MHIRSLVVSAITLLLVTACGGGGGPAPGTPPQEEPPSNSLSAFTSAAALEAYLKDGFRASADNPDLYNVSLETDEFLLASQDALAGFAPATAVSQTTLQEAGVDEADRVKSDGRYLYVAPVPQDQVYYAAITEPAGGTPTFEEQHSIRVLALSEDPARADDVAAIPLDRFENPVDGLYLVNRRAGSAPDLLVAVGGTANTSWHAWCYPWYWQDTRTEIGFFDVSNPAEPQEAAFLSIDGQLLASRRIGERLYLVTRYTPSIPGFLPYPSSSRDREENDALLAETSLEELLPTISLDHQAPVPLVTAGSTYLPRARPDSLVEPTLITVTAIDLSDPSSFVATTLAGPAETVYVSPESLYVATTHSAYRPLIGWLETTSDALVDIAPETTDIHKFALGEHGPVYRGSGTVVGNLGWELGKRPFRFGEDQKVLRVATSLGETWNETSTTRLTLLTETDDGHLAETAHLDNIGEPGERLYAARYAGDRAYLVTFRITDPLYVFDLSDPSSPFLAGELHIDGYSDSLYPIGNDLLLGIGKDAVPDQDSPDFGGRGAWYQGVKLSLFDVGDPADPQEVDALVIGKRSTESDALVNHHAVTFLPASEGRPLRLALPIDLHDTPYTTDWFDPDSPSAHYDWTQTGLYLLEIGDGTIEQTGELIVADRTNGDAPGYSLSGTDRSVLVNDSVYYIHGNDVRAAEWGSE